MPETFKAGDRVLYVPSWVCDDALHPDCERGLVDHVDTNGVWVKYFTIDRYGNRIHTPQLTDSASLVFRHQR